MPDRALIVVDMLNDFIESKGALYCGAASRAIIPFIRGRLAAFRKNDDLVVYLQDFHEKNDKEFDRFPPHCVSGTWGGEIIPELSPVAGDIIIPKSRFSGFYGTDLENVLIAAGIERVEVVGVCTSICVMDTVGGLANRGYEITVPQQGVADFDPEFHRFALKRMQQTYGADIV